MPRVSRRQADLKREAIRFARATAESRLTDKFLSLFGAERAEPA